MPKNVLVLNDSEGSLTPLIEALAQNGYTAYSTDNSDYCVDKFDEVQPGPLWNPRLRTPIRGRSLTSPVWMLRRAVPPPDDRRSSLHSLRVFG